MNVFLTIKLFPLKTLFIDDEAVSLSVFQFLAASIPDLDVIGYFADPHEGLNAILQQKPDLVFLDIEMEAMDGFELLERCPKPLPFQVVFITAYNEYALKALQCSALDFLLKPVSRATLLQVLSLASQKALPIPAQIEQAAHFGRTGMLPDRILFHSSDGFTIVETGEVLYVEADGAYSKVYMQNGNTLVVTKNIGHIEEMLETPRFLRIHHSYIIQANYVRRYIKGEKQIIEMQNGAQLPLSRSKRTDFLDYFDQL